MQAAQRVARLVVIEFGNRADRLPRAGGMAVLAGNIKIPVRTVRTCRLRLRVSRIYHEHHKQCRNRIDARPQTSTWLAPAFYSSQH